MMFARMPANEKLEHFAAFTFKSKTLDPAVAKSLASGVTGFGPALRILQQQPGVPYKSR
jgi:hypothetical protein